MAELVEIAVKPDGLDMVIDAILKGESSAQCTAIEAQAYSNAASTRAPLCQSISKTLLDGTQRNVRFCTENGQLLATPRFETLRWLYAFRYGCNPLRERMALLWHNHFAISFSTASADSRSHYVTEHLAALRSSDNPSTFASIYDLVARMHGKDGQMGIWLQNRQNRFGPGGGNENYARELLELMILGPQDLITGAANYSEAHIYDLRTAVMGHSDEQPADTKTFSDQPLPASCASDSLCASLPESERYINIFRRETNPNFYPDRWNMVTQPMPVTLFAGQPWELRSIFKANTFTPGQDNVTPYLLSSHPGVARYFAARLIATFVTTKLTEDMVAKVAAELAEANWNPAPARKMLLRSSAFYASANRYDGVNNPVEFFITSLRSLGLPMDNPVGGSNLTDFISQAIHGSGFPLLSMPTIFGVQELGKIVGNKVYDGSIFHVGQRFLERLKGMVGYLNRLDSNIVANKTNFTWLRLVPTSPGKSNEPQRSPEALLDNVASMMGLQLTEQQRILLIEYLTQVTPRIRRNAVNNQWEVDPNFVRTIDWKILSSAQFEALARTKVPGLITLLTALHQNNTR